MTPGESNGYVTGDVTCMTVKDKGRDTDIFGCKYLENG